jgi:hypothetical protein
MKNPLKKEFSNLQLFLILLFTSLSVSAQKNTVIVTDANGTGVANVNVFLFEIKPTSCVCFMGGCLFSNPAFDANVTNKNGQAKFAEKGDPQPKPSTTYYASINATCTKTQGQQPCDNNNNLCNFAATFMEFKTDKKGSFDVVKFVK